MTFDENINEEKLAEAALAILSLTAHKEFGGVRAWKGMDWDLLGLLHKKGWIGDPVGKQKSVILSDEGEKLAAQFLEKHFGK
ncbi:MAG: hypothetical protein DRR42_15240 [Gammaproteobacteria bacterium]|nr:MAG: hypothetical protein DRR42_15240 [Gammaproteobacteria bacterium]